MTASKKTMANKLAKVSRSTALPDRNNKNLVKGDELFAQLVESMKDCAIFTLDPEGCVTGWNSGAERLKRYRSDEIIGKHFSCFYSADDIRLGRPDLALKSAAAEGRHEEQSWRIRKDGSLFFGNVIIMALKREGNLAGFSLFTRDLTDLKFAEIARELFESFPDAIVVLDRHGKITRINAQFEAMFGYTAQELQDKPANVLIPERLDVRKNLQRLTVVVYI